MELCPITVNKTVISDLNTQKNVKSNEKNLKYDYRV